MFGICKRKHNNAFTLIELAIVVTIITTLSLILLVSFNRVQANTRDSQRYVKISLIAEALEQYYLNNGEYPDCSMMSQSASVVISTLKDLNRDSLAAPTAPSGTNSIVACEGDPVSDVYHYVGGVNGYVLKYREEISGEVVSVSSRHSAYVAISAVPNSPTVSSNTIADTTTWDWGDVSATCPVGATSSYQYRYTVFPLNYNSGWIEYENLSVSFTTNIVGQTYTVEVQARCGDTYSNGPWSASGNASYTKPSNNEMATLFSSNDNQNCIIASDNNAYCWGNNYSGELGIGSTVSDVLVPTPIDRTGVLLGLTIKSITLGDGHTCVIASDDNAYCWGANGDGQIGDGTSGTNRISPVAVDRTGALSGLTIKSISAGYKHTCALASDDNLYCWGYNFYGQMGNNTSGDVDVLSPTAVFMDGVLSGLTIKSLKSGNEHNCVIASDNNAYCWGCDASGRLGDGSDVVSRPVPVAVDKSGVLSGLTIKSISPGGEGTCVIASDDNAYCWGRNLDGQIGDGSTTTRLTATAVSRSGALSGLTVKSISRNHYIAGDHTCVIASDDNAYCWGSNTDGQVGDGTTGVDKLLPTAVLNTGVLSGLGIKYFSAGGVHNCAIASDNNIYCWGDNADGQIGDGTLLTERLTPTTVRTIRVTSNTVADDTTWSWTGVVCTAPGLPSYQYRYTILPSGYDSGWVNTASSSITFSTPVTGQTYKLEVQLKCPGSGIWISHSASYVNSKPLTAVVPTSYVTATGTAPTTSTYTNINKTVAGYDSLYFVAAANSIGTAFYDITNMPSDFNTMDSLTYNIRYRITPLSGDVETLSVRIYKADRTTPLTNAMLVKSTNVVVPEVSSGNITFTGLNKTATKADWDGAVLAIITNHTASGGKDNSIWSINEVELNGGYQ